MTTTPADVRDEREEAELAGSSSEAVETMSTGAAQSTEPITKAMGQVSLRRNLVRSCIWNDLLERLADDFSNQDMSQQTT